MKVKQLKGLILGDIGMDKKAEMRLYVSDKQRGMEEEKKVMKEEDFEEEK